jgi:hypothetical protein
MIKEALMSDVIEYKGYKITVKQDEDPMNPRGDDFDCNLGKMVCYHSRYKLGDDHEYKTQEEFKEWLRKNEKNVVMLPLYLYDHSGYTMNTTGFRHLDSHGWDWGMLGVIYVTKERIKKEYGIKRNVTKARAEKVKDALRAEVEVYDQYLRNDTYGFQIINPDGEETDSCWGFYGSDNKKSGLLEAAKDAVDADITHRLKHEGIQEELALTA